MNAVPSFSLPPQQFNHRKRKRNLILSLIPACLFHIYNTKSLTAWMTNTLMYN